MSLLFITGTTGFLGGAVLEKILSNSGNVSLLLLVRANTPQSGLNRVKENLRKFNVCEDRLQYLTTDNILIGDLNKPEEFLRNTILEKVTHVINCAAVASFSNNPFIWPVNVTGTLAFAKRMAKVAGLLRIFMKGDHSITSIEIG